MKSEIDFSKGKRGPVVEASPGKVRITIRLDQGVVDFFKQQVHEQGGGNYQTLINEALLHHIARQKGEVFEDTLRRVIREELKIVSERGEDYGKST